MLTCLGGIFQGFFSKLYTNETNERTLNRHPELEYYQPKISYSSWYIVVL